MSDYISREAAIAETRKPRLTDAELRRRLASIPAADVREVVRGEWIEEMVVGGFAESWESTCSICGKGYRDIGKPRYCPNCGADMRKKEQS